MRFIFLLLFVSALLLSGCDKSPCGCEPPPAPSESSWYISKRHGGIAGIDFPLTDAQQNSNITLKPAGYVSGNYTVVYIVNNSTTTGSYNISTSNNQVIYNFSPKLPMLPEDQLILVENTNNQLVFWDGNADGIYTTFTRRQ